MKTRPNLSSRYDVVIVGARLAGAATAMLLARGGRRVLVLDKSAPGSDTTSTHALMRPGVLQLERWGILDRILDAGTPVIRRTTFHYHAPEKSDVIPLDIQPKDGVEGLVAPRRTVFDSVLVDAAREAGAEVRHGCQVEELLTDADGRVTGVQYRDGERTVRRVSADLVIGADGIRSRVARAVGAKTLRSGDRPSACIYGYWRGLELDGTHWYYAPEASAGAIPTNDGLTCIFVAVRPETFRRHREVGLDAVFMEALEAADPELASRVAGAELATNLHPFAGLPGHLREAYGPGWALVGDAGFFRDPLTAHGMTDALRDAEFLARAVLEGTPEAMAAYSRARDEHAVPFLDLSDEVGSFDWDIPTLQTLHYKLSKLMGREYEAIRALDHAEEVLAVRG
ncbi:MAG: NAD(P)/FAD-dependent oxidoreductase [Candidatus Eisenbacteria bacterium]